MLLTPAQNQNRLNRDGTLFFFLPGVDAPHVYMRAWALGCFPQSYQYLNLSEGADRIGGQLRGDKKCPFSGRVLRKVPESGARSVI